MFLLAVNNEKYFAGVIVGFPLKDNLMFVISVAIWLFALLNMLLFIVSNKYTVKPLLIALLIISSIVNYFSSNFGIAVDDNMITNIIQTNIDESLDLLSLKMGWNAIVYGIIPSIVVYKINIKSNTLGDGLLSGSKNVVFYFVLFIVITMAFSKSYTSLVREHRDLRYHINPMYWTYAVGKSVAMQFKSATKKFTHIGKDAVVIKKNDIGKIVVLVLGETARADRFSLNNYKRKTNPLLEQEDVISFTNMYSCGTDTAYSVPCMFSSLKKDEYNHSEGKNMSNVLDIIKNAGVNVVWLDNNSDSKGVADRINYISYKNDEINSICNPECRDEGMVVDIQKYISRNEGKDLLIILHQMGSHGPAYYKRYPIEFKKFTPVCETNQLNECNNEQINNAYDNTILYTDYVLTEVIKQLKKNDEFKSAMFYMSDHGESLGENGLYLHGMPDFIAPKEQTHVSSVLWFSEKFSIDIDMVALRGNSDKELSHDNMFHTLLGLMDIKTDVYDKEMEIVPYVQ